jgi:hypothetical protein
MSLYHAIYTKKLYTYLFILIIGGCFVSASAVVIDKVFTIHTIEIANPSIEIMFDSKKITDNLLFFPSDKIRSQLLTANPQLSDLVLKKKFPNTLIFIPTLRTPVARLNMGKRVVFVDTDGIILSDATGESYPYITIDVPQGAIGQKVADPRVLGSLQFLEYTSAYLPISEFDAYNTEAIRAKAQKVDILFTQNQDMKNVADTLQTLLAGFRIKGIMPTLIDLRFEKPIIQ